MTKAITARVVAGAITLRGLHFRYGSAPVLDGVTCTVDAGEHVAIIGQSGAGKSTLLHLIAGLLHPAKGQVLIDGVAAEKATRSAVLMFQRPALLPWASVRDNILLPVRFSGKTRGDLRAAQERVH
jgi:NitT/TauT family transport system ATP-binding protein